MAEPCYKSTGLEMPASAKILRTWASPLARFSARAVRRLIGERSGIAAIEFAMLSGVFVVLLFMVAQIGLYFYFSTTLYYVTQKATRQILTGAVVNGSSTGLTAAQYRTQILCPILAQASYGSMSCNNIITNVQVVPAWSGYTSGGFYSLTNIVNNTSNSLGYTMTGLTTPPMNNNQTSFCIGSPGSVVVAQVYYAMPVLGIPAMLTNASSYNGSSVVFISATSVFKNEPFLNNPNYTGC
jgi:Flp pilus assembly protein TadG